MPLRLSDPNHTKIVELSGTRIHIRSLTNVQKMRMGLLWRSDGIPLTGVEDVDKSVIAHEYTEKLVANYKEVAEAIAPAIVKIEGFESLSVLNVLLNMEDISDFMQLMTAIMEFSTLSDGESKNLPSSLDTSPAKPMGDRDSIAGNAKDTSDASPKKATN